MNKLIDSLKENFKKSYFIVNKLYLFFGFIIIALADLALGFWYFIISIFVFAKKVATASIPMEVKEDFKVDTFIYKETKEKDLKLDLYYPNDYHKDKYPLVYFCHGGGWISGYRDQPNNVSWCRFLASKGFLVASIDYRFGYKNTMLDLLSDYDDGLEFLKSNPEKYKLDLDNIVLMGLSAGAHLSLLYASYLTHIGDNKRLKGINAVVGYYPPTNLSDLMDGDLNKSLFAKFGARKTLEGSPVGDNCNVYQYYSPINWLGEDMLPTLIAHGKEDETVPFKSSVDFTNKLDSLNIPYEFLVHNSADHVFDTELNDFTTIDIIEKTVRFIRKYTE